MFLVTVIGSIVAGPALAWLTLRLLVQLQHVPTAIILQFVTTFGIAWAYQRFSARRLDPLADHVRDEFEKEIES